jgi:dUTP pyrophosphatase
VTTDDAVPSNAVVALQVLRLDPTLKLPSYAHNGDAGMDLCSAVEVTLAPFERALIPTGIALAIPEGYAGFVLPRSGLAARSGLSLVNSPGLIDSHYRGEVKVIAINLDPVEPIRIARGDRVAQLVIQGVARCEAIEVSALPETVRGEGGFGSTGL